MAKKKQSHRYDFLIIGQGLAGSLIAWRLWHAGAKIMVVDTGTNNASKVAAGLVSPITGKRWVKMQQIEMLLHNARQTYRWLETALGTQLWFEHPLLRLYRNRAERSLAARRIMDTTYQNYLGKELDPGDAGYGLADDLGGRWIQGAAHLATNPLLQRLRNWLEEKNAFRPHRFAHADLSIEYPRIKWMDVVTEFVIFCEGWNVIHNPWFATLPWQPSAGEILTLECQDAFPPYPINRGIWLLPESMGKMRMGATYRWQPLSESPSTEGVEHLLMSLRELFHTPPKYQYSAVTAGIRPNTLDHQPILGSHPNFPRLILCNGFGSKGSLYAPWCSQILTEHLIHGHALPPHISIERYLDAPYRGRSKPQSPGIP